eukprot:1156184-Pelagomonas_calceolata.AAC.25
MGVALDKLLGCVHGLLHAQLLPRGWLFDTSQTWSVLKRVRMAAVKAGPESWHITHTVQRWEGAHFAALRLMFEAGRQVMGLLDRDEVSRDVLARVLLHSMGQISCLRMRSGQSRHSGLLLGAPYGYVRRVCIVGCMYAPQYACNLWHAYDHRLVAFRAWRVSACTAGSMIGMILIFRSCCCVALPQAHAKEEQAKADRILEVPMVSPPKPTRSSRIPSELLGGGSGRPSSTAPPTRCSGECDAMQQRGWLLVS